jgi:hypothetical protein
MPHQARTSPARPRDVWLTPLPHPSWSGEATASARPLAAAEFWRRLGL